MKKVCVLGDGAFGTAFAQLIAKNGFEVNLWCYNKLVYDSISKTGINKVYLPDIKLDPKIKPTTNIKEALESIDIIFEAIPTQFLKQVLEPISILLSNKTICVLTKGIETYSLNLPTQILENILKKDFSRDLNLEKVVISGPSFAKDLALGTPTGLVLASNSKQARDLITDILKNSNIYLEFTEDILGVQVAGAVKNVIALGVGILDGAGYLDNAKALYFYKSLEEAKKLIKHFGGKVETLYNLSGIGDLVLTAFMSQGRNKKVGFEIGRGVKLCDILNQSDFVPEGANTVKSIFEISQKNNLDIPIFKTIYDIVYKGSNPEDLILKII